MMETKLGKSQKNLLLSTYKQFASIQKLFKYKRGKEDCSNIKESVHGYIKSNKIGTCYWHISPEGILYIGSGQLSCTFNCSPWKDYWKSISKIVISKEVIAPENSSFLFADLFNVTEIEGLENLDTSNVENMSYMFAYMYKLKGLNLINFDTSKVKNMDSMFVNDTSSLVTLDISNFETDNVENMCKMFAGQDKLTTLNLTNFNFTKVNNRELMLSGMKNLTNLYMDKYDKFKIAGE